MEVGLSPGDFVLDGDLAPTLKGAEPHQFSAHVYCGQTAAWITMPRGMEVGLGLRDIVFDMDPAAPRKKGTSTLTQFLANVYCGEMAGWIKTPLGSKENLDAGHIVLDGVLAPAKGAQRPSRPLSFVGHGRPSQLLLSSC